MTAKERCVLKYLNFEITLLLKCPLFLL